MGLTVAEKPAVTSPIWSGRPYILPDAVGRTIVVAILAIVAVWLEYIGMAFTALLGIPIIAWTVLVFFIVWLVSLANLLLLRATNKYALRRDSLQVQYGIITTRAFTVTPAGFSNLEVVKTLYSRIFNFGYIDVRTQGERNIRMVRVKDPIKVSDQIKEVMARPTVRIETDEGALKK